MGLEKLELESGQRGVLRKGLGLQKRLGIHAARKGRVVQPACRLASDDEKRIQKKKKPPDAPSSRAFLRRGAMGEKADDLSRPRLRLIL